MCAHTHTPLYYYLCIKENTARFENYFSEAVEERLDVLGSELFQNHLWEIPGNQYNYFVKPFNSPDDNNALVTWLHLPLRYLVASSIQFKHVFVATKMILVAAPASYTYQSLQINF